MTPEIFMQKAAELAQRGVATGEGGPFGALVVCDGVVIAEGWNRVTSTNDPTAHAEIVAIRAACQALGRFDLRGCEVYTSCEPCPMCLAALYWARVDRVWFANSRADAAAIGFDDDLLYREIPLPLDQRSLPIVHLPSQAAADSFRAWIDKPDRVPY